MNRRFVPSSEVYSIIGTKTRQVDPDIHLSDGKCFPVFRERSLTDPNADTTWKSSA
jgi:hypothetical protein